VKGRGRRGFKYNGNKKKQKSNRQRPLGMEKLCTASKGAEQNVL
jgi:hypothetical protein